MSIEHSHDLELHREHDVRFAYAIAEVLNLFVKSNVLSTSHLTSAPNEIIEKFIDRFQQNIQDYFLEEEEKDRLYALEQVSQNETSVIDCYQLLLDWYFNEEDQKKVKTLFGSINAEEYKQINLKRESVLKLMKDFFVSLKKKHPDLKGFLLFGSRVSFNSLPREDSDLDVFLLTSDDFSGWDSLMLNKEAEFFNLPHIHLLNSTPLSRFFKKIEDLTKSRGNTVIPSYCNYFIWDRGVCFISDENEEKFNLLIQEFLNSEAVHKYKTDVMNKIKNKIRG